MGEVKLPILKAIKPVATCEVCSLEIYPDGQCRMYNGQPSSCPLRGVPWLRWKLAMDMQNIMPPSDDNA